MTAQGVGQLHFPSCLIPTPPPPIPIMGVVGHTIDSCITFSYSKLTQIITSTFFGGFRLFLSVTYMALACTEVCWMAGTLNWKKPYSPTVLSYLSCFEETFPPPLGLSAIANKSTLLIYSCNVCIPVHITVPWPNIAIMASIVSFHHFSWTGFNRNTILFSLAGTVIAIPQECYSILRKCMKLAWKFFRNRHSNVQIWLWIV